jgi:hypothetical protein
MTLPASEGTSFGLAEIVALVHQCIRTQETTIPAAVAEVWSTISEQVEPGIIGELARRGLAAEVQRALHNERFLSPRIISPRTIAIAPRSHNKPPPSPVRQVRVSLFERVRYAGRDNVIRPLIRFILTDVEAAIEDATQNIEGRTRVRAFFYALRDALQAHGTDRVAELPQEVLAGLAQSAPFATD